MPDQSEHDPIDELARFGAELGRAGGDMPLSAVDARRRGDQIRRRRTTLVAGGAALAVAAVITPILALTGNGGDRDLTTKDPAAALSEHDLLTDDDTVYSDGADWFAIDPEEGTAAFRFCEPRSLSDFGAASTRRRDFELRNAEVSVEVSGDAFRESIGQFPDVASAREAYDEVVAFVQECGARVGRTFDPRPVDPGVGDSEAVVVDGHYPGVPEDLDPYGDAAYISEVGVARVGARIAVLDSVIVGQDYNYVDGTPVERMIPVAADRLQPGPDEPFDPTTVPGTRIADDFPLAAGWPETGSDSPEPLTGPLRGLDPLVMTACDRSTPDPRRSDRLSAQWVDVEDVRNRQLTTYPTEDDAAAAAAGFVQAFRACPQGLVGDDGTTQRWDVRDVDAGDEAYAVLGWQQADGGATPFGDTTLVVRVGRSVLIESRGGHAGNPQGREQEVVAAISTDATQVVDAMCAFTDGGC
ncbi:hypothetical protein KVF89_17580 [Nocardioides carbamazepini]|uniref:hypothetical protein n=1 Tax=Nocardioides carbamazepini TaxID=2854259 RepID=UPI002149E3AE|nr:hypothetical protein [Nocardioides carbamazepini]MCR1784357.1 hypothetical protein [Nocardioides carbamazepini]